MHQHDFARRHQLNIRAELSSCLLTVRPSLDFIEHCLCMCASVCSDLVAIYNLVIPMFINLAAALCRAY